MYKQTGYLDPHSLNVEPELIQPVRIREHYENRDLRLFLPGDMNYALAEWLNIYDR